ncbi:MAG TPA: hypothetical protein DEQ14_11670 [Treponema sp.]|nr:hypothetical protein [Treponema sp.]
MIPRFLWYFFPNCRNFVKKIQKSARNYHHYTCALLVSIWVHCRMFAFLSRGRLIGFADELRSLAFSKPNSTHLLLLRMEHFPHIF